MEEAKLTEVLLTIFSTLGVLVLMRALVAAAHEFMIARRKRDEEAPYKLERPDGYPPLNLAVPESPYPNRKRPYTKRSEYWAKPKRKRHKKYTKRSAYWKNGEAQRKAAEARAAQAAKRKAKTTK
jgi:hypothetical protein